MSPITIIRKHHLGVNNFPEISKRNGIGLTNKSIKHLKNVILYNEDKQDVIHQSKQEMSNPNPIMNQIKRFEEVSRSWKAMQSKLRIRHKDE